MNVRPGDTFEAISPELQGELDGIVGVRIRTSDGNDFLERTTDDITADVTLGASALYRVTLTAPTVAGRYWIVWDDGTALADPVELVVTHTAAAPEAPDTGNLCTLADVLGYIPGYRPNATVEAKLLELIAAESQLIQKDTGREINPATAQPQTRRVDLWNLNGYARIIRVGDLASIDGLAVDVLRPDDVIAETVDPDTIVPLYDGERQPRFDWEPITDLAFPRSLPGAARFGVGRGSLSIAGTWGFPAIPEFIRQACAKRVLLRFVTDVAAVDFNDATQDLNLGALFRSSQEAIDTLKGGVLIS